MCPDLDWPLCLRCLPKEKRAPEREACSGQPELFQWAQGGGVRFGKAGVICRTQGLRILILPRRMHSLALALKDLTFFISHHFYHFKWVPWAEIGAESRECGKISLTKQGAWYSS